MLASGLAVSGLAPPAAGKTTKASDVVRIKVLSNRASLVSGGDALVEIVIPKGTVAKKLKVKAGRRDVTKAFAPRRLKGGRILGMVKGLKVGRNQLTASLPNGRGARITVTNHPIGGPVFSGRQVQPWLCDTEAAGLGPPQDKKCNATTKYEFLYKHAITMQFEAYDPDSPPPAPVIASTTTDHGYTVPYIVRRETGTQNRGIYRIAVLFDPSRPWKPWAPQSGWNGKLYYLYQGGYTSQHRQENSPGNVLHDVALSRGFAVASSSLNVHDQNTNFVKSAEATMMAKERVIETLGEIRYTMSEGGSGGSMQQHQIAGAYPGLLDGIQPTATYMDVWTTHTEVQDCSLMVRYFNKTSPHLWASAQQRAAAAGQFSTTTCESWVWAYFLDKTAMDPTFGCTQAITDAHERVEWLAGINQPEWRYDPEANPTGTRCAFQDYQVAMFGRRPPGVWGPVERQIKRGFANRPYDNVGVQYGRVALEDGTISPEQFVDLNEKVGAYDIDMGWQPERSTADPFALKVAYRTGLVAQGHHLDKVPSIDGSFPANVEIHTAFRAFAMRERLRKANGHANNQVIVPEVDSFDLLDRWLTAIEADRSKAPIEVKVVRNKPSDAVDGPPPDYYGDPHTGAGAPLVDDVLKCQIKPHRRSDYSVEFTDEQWSRLQKAFPSGVCNWTREGVGYGRPVAWLTYEDGPGGEALGAAPRSVPFGR